MESIDAIIMRDGMLLDEVERYDSNGLYTLQVIAKTFKGSLIESKEFFSCEECVEKNLKAIAILLHQMCDKDFFPELDSLNEIFGSITEDMLNVLYIPTGVWKDFSVSISVAELKYFENGVFYLFDPERIPLEERRQIVTDYLTKVYKGRDDYNEESKEKLKSFLKAALEELELEE